MDAMEMHEKDDYEDIWDDRYLSRDGDVNVDIRGRPSNMARTGTWRSALFTYALVAGENLAFFGLVGNLVYFYTNTLDFTPSRAAIDVTNFVGTSFATTVLWGFVADSYYGKFWTASLGGIIEVLGAVIMGGTVALYSPLPPNGEVRFMRAFNAGLYLVAIGSGGVKACAAVFGADQFDKSIPAEKVGKTRYFNFLYLAFAIGSLLSVTVITYVMTSQNKVLGFGVIAGVLLLSLVSFWFGIRFYRHKLPSGSAFTRLAQVVVATLRNRELATPDDPSMLYEVVNYKGSAIRGSGKLKHSSKLRIFDKAAVIRPEILDREPSPWVMCTVTQVEELKRLLLMTPIWLTSCVVYVIFAQCNSFTIYQASTMDRHIGTLDIPSSSVGAFSILAIIILIPIYDQVFVPIIRRFTRHPQGITTLQRIGLGIFFAVLAMVAGALVESKRVAAMDAFQSTLRAPRVGMSAYWLLPQYFFVALTELFTTVGQLEFFYNEAPDSVRNIAISYYFTSYAVGNFLSTAVVSIVNTLTGPIYEGSWLLKRERTDLRTNSWLKYPTINLGGLTRFYYLLALIVVVDLLLYLVVAYMYEYRIAEVEDPSHSIDQSDPLEAGFPKLSNKPIMVTTMTQAQQQANNGYYNDTFQDPKEIQATFHEVEDVQDEVIKLRKPVPKRIQIPRPHLTRLPQPGNSCSDDLVLTSSEDSQPYLSPRLSELINEAKFKLQLFRKSTRSPRQLQGLSNSLQSPSSHVR